MLYNFMLSNKNCVRGKGTGLRWVFFVWCFFIFCLWGLFCFLLKWLLFKDWLGIGMPVGGGESLFASLVFSHPSFLQVLNCLYLNLQIFSLRFFLFPPLSHCVCGGGERAALWVLGYWPESTHHTSSFLSFPFMPLVVNEMCLLQISPSMRPTAYDFSVSVQNVMNQLPKRI